MQLHSHVIAATSAEKLILIYSRIQAPRCPGVISPGSGTREPNLLLPWLQMLSKGLASQVSNVHCPSRIISRGTISFQRMSLIENTKASRCFTIGLLTFQKNVHFCFHMSLKCSIYSFTFIKRLPISQSDYKQRLLTRKLSMYI